MDPIKTYPVSIEDGQVVIAARAQTVHKQAIKPARSVLAPKVRRVTVRHRNDGWTNGGNMRGVNRGVNAASSIAALSILAAITLLGWASSAFADGSSRPYGGGGRIGAGEIIRKYNQSGERFRIEGSCQSSCTMLLAIKNVCVEPDATLLFHAALFPNEKGQKPPPQRQAQMLNSYKPKLRSYLVSNHYVDTFEFHAISGRDIIQKFGYRACPPK